MNVRAWAWISAYEFVQIPQFSFRSFSYLRTFAIRKQLADKPPNGFLVEFKTSVFSKWRVVEWITHPKSESTSGINAHRIWDGNHKMWVKEMTNIKHTSMERKNWCVTVYSCWPAKSHTVTSPPERLRVLQSTPMVLLICVSAWNNKVN